jgi:single-strand DNA-binding protein
MPDTFVTVAGNCVADPEVRVSNKGTSVLSFAVAVTGRKKNESSGQWENGDTSFFDVVCFGKLAENVAESVSKGKRVIVMGSLRQSSWEKDGQKRSKVELVADEVGPSLKWDSVGASSSPARPSSPARVVDEEPF